MKKNKKTKSIIRKKSNKNKKHKREMRKDSDELKIHINKLLKENLTSNEITDILNAIFVYDFNNVIKVINSIDNVNDLIIIKSAVINYTKTNNFLIEMFKYISSSFTLGVSISCIFSLFTDLTNKVVYIIILLIGSILLLIIVNYDVSRQKLKYNRLIDIIEDSINYKIQKL